jgi:hypothetical protein
MIYTQLNIAANVCDFDFAAIPEVRSIDYYIRWTTSVCRMAYHI